MRGTLIISLLVAALAAGCYSEESVGVGYSAGYYGAAPGLVEVSPGVQVVYDYDYPVFFSDGFYWRYDGGVWYRSGYYNGGWAVAYDVPVGVRRIDRPYAYSHYRAGGGVVYGGRGGAVVRDHRTYGGPAPAYRAAPAARGAVVRDHRH